MKSVTTVDFLSFSAVIRMTRKVVLLDKMERVVPWSRLVNLIAPHSLDGGIGRPPFPLEVMLRIHFLQQWFNPADPATKEAVFATPLYRAFVDLGENECLPDESTILRFRHLLEEHDLAAKMLAEANAVLTECVLMFKQGSAVDIMLIAARSPIKYKPKSRDPDMQSSQKRNQLHFAMKSDIGLGSNIGPVHTARCASSNHHDITLAHRLLRGHELTVWADAGYQGIEKRDAADPDVAWHVATRQGKRKALKHTGHMVDLLTKAEKNKAGVRAKLAHPFRSTRRRAE